LGAGVGEFSRELRDGQVLGGGAGDEHQVTTRRHEVLVLAKRLTEAAFGAVAADGVADGSGRSDDTDARQVRCDREFRGDVAVLPPHSEGAAIDTTTLFADDADVALAAQVLLRAETHEGVARRARVSGAHSLGRVATDESRLGLDDRQALAAFEAAGADDFASAGSGHAGAITDLAGAFLTVWAECWLHDFCRKRG